MLSKRQGIECKAKSLLAPWKGLYYMTLVVIHCNDLTVIVLRIMFRMYKESAVL